MIGQIESSVKSFDASMLQAWSAFSDEFIAVWDDTAVDLLYFNDSFSKLFGFNDRNEFKTYYQFFCPREHPIDENLLKSMVSTIKQHGNWTEEVLLKKRNGDVFLGRLDTVMFSYDGQDFYLQRIIDIDAQRVLSLNIYKELELKVAQRTQELTAALSKERELSDLKSRFVSMASHEFRTPLSTILSSVSLIG